MRDTTANKSKVKEIFDEIEQIAPYLKDENRDDYVEFRKRFGDILPQWTEYSISPLNEELGIMTRGVGSDFEDEIKSYLKASGIMEKNIRFFDSVRRYFPDVNILAKRDFNIEKTFNFTFYWQHLIPIRHLLRLGARYKISKDVLGFFEEAALLMRSQSVYIGMGFNPPDDVSFKVFFANSLRKSTSYIAPALSALMAKLGLSAKAINYFIGFHNFLFPVATGSVFTSIGFSDKIPHSVKLDYEIVPLQHALQMMRALDLAEDQEDRLKKTMEILDIKRITYVGIKFSPGRKPGIKFYFDRRYSEKNRDNPEVLADFLQNSIWTP
ncbi:MAG: hypothetical protein K8T10_18750 [Candidatus Eremiobacteraeota bacterium]|nr:hypothetical protein [Candidatus Eremiobacteraeota bacterium]